jgi:hypothetical protein
VCCVLCVGVRVRVRVGADIQLPAEHKLEQLVLQYIALSQQALEYKGIKFDANGGPHTAHSP